MDLNLGSAFWNNFERATCFPLNCGCEELGSTFLLQPYNSLTSLPLVFLGLWGLLNFRGARLKLLALAFFSTGLGSFTIHASFTKLGEVMDFGGISVIFSWLFCSALFRSSKRNQAFGLCFVLLGSGSYVFIYFLGYYRFAPPFVILALFLAVCAKDSLPAYLIRQPKRTLRAAALLGAGFVFFALDNTRLYCHQQAALQGHVLWHAMAFIACLLFYRLIKESWDRE